MRNSRETMKSSKPKNISKTSRRLISDFKTQIPPFIIVITFLICSAVLSIITPIILRDVLNNPIDYISVNIAGETGSIAVNYGKLFSVFGLMLGLYAAAALFSWAADFIVIKISAIFAYEMRSRIKTKLDFLPLSYYDRYTYGEILSRGTNDVDNISRNLSNIVNQTVYSIAQFIGVLIAMFIVNWQLSLVTLATLPLTIGVVAVIAIQSQKQFSKYRSQLGNLNSIIEESYGGHKIIKLFNKEDDKYKQFEAVNAAMTKSDRMSQWLSGFIFPSMRFVNNLGFVAISVVGGILTNIGDMVVFFMFLQIFQTPFQNLGQIAGIVQSVVSSGERIYELLDEQEILPDDVDCINSEESIKGKIEFKKVCFSYLPKKPLINNMNISINEGDSIAIVGPTGAGKTTIVNLLMRFYEVNSGEITLDGININHYSRAALRGSVGMVLQDTWLFEGTIKDNIRYGRNDATDEEIIEAAKNAHAHHFIETLPGGYDFKLNEDGTNISQGQRQLLTIARAIISKPKILILDEATSNVDTRTEKAIQDAMNKMMVGKTSFIIAHRLSTIKNAKTIIVMKKGSIIEIGNHEELLKANGFYADLYNAQFLGRNPLAPQETN